jgi:hypothetical protein
MAKVQCPKCNHSFDGSTLKGKAAATAGAAVGAYYGSGLGIAGGPLGAIAGTIPGAAIGGLVGYLGSNKFYKCPECNKFFKL